MSQRIRAVVGMEYSARVRDALRIRGVDAWSVDLLDTEGDPRWHWQGDIFEFFRKNGYDWDLAIFHPDCTYLTNAGVRWLYQTPKKPKPGILYGAARWGAMHAAGKFFRRLRKLPLKRVALENPIPHSYARAYTGDYTQTIQPWQFGQPYTKRTCLWLQNLPELEPTAVLPPPYIAEAHHASPGPERWKARSRTYSGIADAMAEQWVAAILAELKAA